jgi:hypothetical protein
MPVLPTDLCLDHFLTPPCPCSGTSPTRSTLIPLGCSLTDCLFVFVGSDLSQSKFCWPLALVWITLTDRPDGSCQVELKGPNETITFTDQDHWYVSSPPFSHPSPRPHSWQPRRLSVG